MTQDLSRESLYPQSEPHPALCPCSECKAQVEQDNTQVRSDDDPEHLTDNPRHKAMSPEAAVAMGIIPSTPPTSPAS